MLNTEEEKPYVGDLGTEIYVPSNAIDNDALVTQLKFRKGTNDEIIVDAIPIEMDGKYYYRYVTDMEDSFFTVSGIYFVQRYMESGVFKGHSKTISFKVYDRYK